MLKKVNELLLLRRTRHKIVSHLLAVNVMSVYVFICAGIHQKNQRQKLCKRINFYSKT